MTHGTGRTGDPLDRPNKCYAEGTQVRAVIGVPQWKNRVRIVENVYCMEDDGHPGFHRSFTGWEWEDE